MPQAEALIAWRAETKIIRDSGYKNAAIYMKHAEVHKNGNPSTHTSNNNAWAKDVLFNNGIIGNTWSQYRTWIIGNKKTLTVKGSYAFTSGDKKLSLQKVNYSYTFTRQANGGLKITGTVTDTYDLAWSNYENVIVAFAKNYAVHATEPSRLHLHKFSYVTKSDSIVF
ncbi:hypothetical protein [Vagococcus salmoninarum]|uniref:hypothetical protein n=1 Tax=Vagococcus salmoninarum TaxID=2739 RepID=UPI001881D23B|nr:hypothetical protein [Vagococcus salmoninarum]MBE9389948.1 hypothetical protein [Vagococcus salmoninarum]